MADTAPIYKEAARLSQEAYKAAKESTDTIVTDMSSRTASIFRETVEKARVRVNEVGERAMAEAVQDLAYKGIHASSHVDKNGRLYRVPSDVAVRQAVYTSGRQRFNGQVLGVAQRTGQDLIEVNSTPNCRPSHEVINGGVFSISGLNPKYRRWTGDMQALLSDYNCGHEIAIYYPDSGSVFTDPLKGTGYTLEQARKAFAKQRRYENEIRKQKRVVEALKAGGMDTTEANAKLNATRHRLKKHIDENSAILRRERHREQLYDSAQRMKNRSFPPPSPKAPSKIKRSGAFNGALNSTNDPYGRRRDAHAERYYEEVRNRDKRAEISAVAMGSGLPEEVVKSAYEHLFENKHMLDGEMKFFDADYEIARSWQRLREGKDVQPQDIVLLQHEALEKSIMEEEGLEYRQAHDKAESAYNYSIMVL